MNPAASTSSLSGLTSTLSTWDSSGAGKTANSLADLEDQTEILGGEEVTNISPQLDTTQPVLLASAEEKFIL